MRRSGFREVELGANRSPTLSEFYGPLAEEKSMALTLEVSGSDHAVRGDPDLLAQAIGNLLDNAIKYAPAGGSVAIRLRLPSE